MYPFEVIEVQQKVVACDGGKGALGHPRVYLNMGDNDHVDCPYCSRRYAYVPPKSPVHSAHG